MMVYDECVFDFVLVQSSLYHILLFLYNLKRNYLISFNISLPIVISLLCSFIRLKKNLNLYHRFIHKKCYFMEKHMAYNDIY